MFDVCTLEGQPREGGDHAFLVASASGGRAADGIPRKHPSVDCTTDLRQEESSVPCPRASGGVHPKGLALPPTLPLLPSVAEALRWLLGLLRQMAANLVAGDNRNYFSHGSGGLKSAMRCTGLKSRGQQGCALTGGESIPHLFQFLEALLSWGRVPAPLSPRPHCPPSGHQISVCCFPLSPLAVASRPSPHLGILNLITSTKTLSPYMVTFKGSSE